MRNTLTSLDLDSNNFRSEGTEIIANALKATSCLPDLTNLMQENRTLAELSVGSNEIGDRGAAAICEALQAGTVHCN